MLQSSRAGEEIRLEGDFLINCNASLVGDRAGERMAGDMDLVLCLCCCVRGEDRAVLFGGDMMSHWG